jgi:predicted esterase
MRSFFSAIVFLFLFQFSYSQNIVPPNQPKCGPGSTEYAHDSLIIHNFAENPDGYWLYEPACPKPDSANVVVFMHGYGAYNPMIYGAWIKHLVLKGNIVIYPRYQKNLFSPSTDKFVENAAKGIRDALLELRSGNYTKPIIDQISFVGHSYGGVISANLGINYRDFDIPYPNVLMLCSPGTGPFSGGLLENYSEIPEDTKLLVLVGEDDKTVGDKIGKLIYETAEKVKNRNLLRQFHDAYGKPNITAGHNESYGVDEYFDTGLRNISTSRAKRKGEINATDYYGYWKLFDALLDCARSNENCNIAFGNTPEQRSLGKWSDGTSIKEFEVIVPDFEKETQVLKSIESTQ